MNTTSLLKSSDQLDGLKNLQTKYNLTKEKLFQEDLMNLMYLFNIEPEKKEEIANKLLSELDKQKKGYINVIDLLNEIVTYKEILSKEELVSFNLQNANLSKSELIIVKLKNMRLKSWLVKDIESQSSIDYIIKSIAEQSLYDIEIKLLEKQFTQVNCNNNTSTHYNHEIAFLIKYSQLEDVAQTENDIISIRRMSKVALELAEKNNLKALEGIANENNNKVKKSDKKINKFSSVMIFSPSLFATLSIYLEKISQVDFDIFEIDKLIGKKTTMIIATEILSSFNLITNEVIDKKVLNNFIKEIVSNYNRDEAINHNDLHAGDVMQTVYTILIQGDVAKKAQLEELDIFSFLIAALCHDFKHPGKNNQFQINSKTKIAMRYNDQSVLENYHISQTFKVLYKNDFNIFEHFHPEEFRISRKRIIQSILSTDMANHLSVLSAMKSKMTKFNISKGKNFECIATEANNQNNVSALFDAQQCIQNMIIHFSDISDPAKPAHISKKWTRMVYAELFKQGDIERELNLPITMLCDRNTTNINKAMIGYMNYVVEPSVKIIIELFPQVQDYYKFLKQNQKKHELGAKKDQKKAEKNNIGKSVETTV